MKTEDTIDKVNTHTIAKRKLYITNEKIFDYTIVFEARYILVVDSIRIIFVLTPNVRQHPDDTKKILSYQISRSEYVNGLLSCNVIDYAGIVFSHLWETFRQHLVTMNKETLENVHDYLQTQLEQYISEHSLFT